MNINKLRNQAQQPSANIEQMRQMIARLKNQIAECEIQIAQIEDEIETEKAYQLEADRALRDILSRNL